MPRKKVAKKPVDDMTDEAIKKALAEGKFMAHIKKVKKGKRVELEITVPKENE